MAMAVEKRDRPKVLVVGSGLAGLTSAYLLRQEGCEVYLVEKSHKLGFHSSSVDIPLSSPRNDKKDSFKGRGKAGWTVDVPMRSFQGGYYPQLIGLYKHLGLPLVPAHFNFSFSRTTGGNLETLSTYFIYSGSNGLSIPSFPYIAFRTTFTLLHALLYFVYSALSFLALIVISFCSWHGLFPSTLGYESTLDSLQRKIWFLPLVTFIDHIFVPIFSSVGTMTIQDVKGAPLPVLLEYVYSTFGTDHYSIGGGLSASSIAERLARPVREQGEGYLRLGASIQELRWVDGMVEVVLEDGTIQVDKVIIATQASSAQVLLEMLLPSVPIEEKRRVGTMLKGLDEVEYRETIIITHRDASVLPHPRDVRTINFILPSALPRDELDYTFTPSLTPSGSSSVSDSSGPPTPTVEKPIIAFAPYFDSQMDSTYTMATHVISPPHDLRKTEARVFQTTNPVVRIDQRLVLGTARLERALPLPDATTLERLHPSVTRESIVHLAGSYAYPGIPLLEGCVGSARLAAKRVLGDEVTDPGAIDWAAGEGGRVGRIWRWRRSKPRL